MMNLSLPRAGWLAIGAVAAGLLSQGGSLALPLPPQLGVVLACVAVAASGASALAGRAGLAALSLGAGTVLLRASVAASLATSATAAPPLPLGSGTWDGDVVDVSSPSGIEQRAFVRLSGDRAPGQWLVYAWLPRHPALVPGDRIATRGTLQAPPTDGSGFAGFLESRGAAGTLKAHAVELTGNRGGVAASVERLRWAIDGLLARAIPEPEAGLAAGILIGLRERVSREVAEDFTTTGLTHVVAISGWNIALVAGIATALLRATGLARRPRNGIVIAAIVAYTILAGAEASVIRAAAMGGVVIVARESGRPSSAAAALGLACWGLLLVQPSMIEDIGLQLSLAATAGLLALGGHAESAVRRSMAGRAPRWFCETLGVSLAAQLATLPLILLHFGRLSLISPLANLLVAPVVPMAMLGGVIGALLGTISTLPAASLVGAPLALLAWLPLALMTRGAEILAGVPMANVELVAPFDLAGAAVAMVALIAAVHLARRGGGRRRPQPWQPPPPTSVVVEPRRRLAAVLVATVVTAAMTVVLVARPSPSLQLSVLDVGQGDAILLEAADGDRVLVDGGPDPDLLVRRLDERIPVWDRRIDVVILTHPHEDHSGGLAGLMPRYRIGRIAETGMRSEGSGVRELRGKAQRHGVPRVRLSQGDELTLGSASIVVLWPPRDAIPDTAPSTGRGINDTSIVLGLSIGRQRALLTGDLEEDRDADLLDALPQGGQRWDVLKVAHHGSATASSAPLLQALRPRIAAISAGTDNRYGHPARATLERLADIDAHVWRTDRDGTLSFPLDGQPRDATAMLAGPPRPPPCPGLNASGPTAQTEPSVACYARPDGGPHPSRSALTADVYLTIATTAATHDRSRGGGLIPGLSRHASRRGGGSPLGRNSRAPP